MKFNNLNTKSNILTLPHLTRMDRRTFVTALSSLAFATNIGKVIAADSSLQSVRGGIIDAARSYFRTTDWAPRREFGDVEKTFYCNIFVADMCRKVKGDTWDKVAGLIGKISPRDPLAAEWADPKFVIKGWEVVYHHTKAGAPKRYHEIFTLRQGGDIVAGGGHVGILSDEQYRQSGRLGVYSASAVTGAIEFNDWSSRLPNTNSTTDAAKWQTMADTAASRFTVRRFVGVK